jgi:hypothetical protein
VGLDFNSWDAWLVPFKSDFYKDVFVIINVMRHQISHFSGESPYPFLKLGFLLLYLKGFCNPFDEFHNGCFALLRVITKTFLWGYPFGCAYKSIVCNMVGLEEGKLQHNMM